MGRIKGIILILLLPLILYSCGIPSYCTLNRLSCTVSPNENSGTINITGADTDLSKVTVGPGLLVCYLPLKDGESLAVDKSGNIVANAFAELVKTKLNIEDDFILSVTDTETSKVYSLYAFQVNNKSVRGPSYTLDLRDAGFISGDSINTGVISVHADFDHNTEKDKNSILYYPKGNDDTLSLTLNPTQISEETVAYYVFAAYSAEVGLFSNNWWSSLYYLGEFSSFTID